MGQIGCAVLGLVFMVTMIATAMGSGNWSFALAGVIVLAIPLYRGYRQAKQQAQRQRERQRATTIPTGPPAPPHPTSPREGLLPDSTHAPPVHHEGADAQPSYKKRGGNSECRVDSD